ncbi:DJ-1/PfpI family protein [Streptomyces synnematoformans]|uniref:Type 1 glutamine amidotransferase family protein n=1 Tax=Streptomyces synnematoformans TaxID=415721 RepID=A0ABN2Z703_9ACTN
MARRIVHLAVYDTLADWETGHAVAHIRETSLHRPPRDTYEVVTVGPEAGRPVTTMGGVRILPDLALDDLRPEDSTLLIMPGATLWDTGGELAPYARGARAFLAAGVPVAAICGAVAGLAREGLLDDRAHTGAAAEYVGGQPGYGGHARYVEADAVTDGGLLVTAGPTEPVAFAREVFRMLDLHEPEVLDAWVRLFGSSDPSAFPVLMEAGSR